MMTQRSRGSGRREEKDYVLDEGKSRVLVPYLLFQEWQESLSQLKWPWRFELEFKSDKR